MTLHPIPSAARRLSPPDPLAISQPVPPARAPTDSLAAAVGSLPQADGVVGLTYAAPPAAAPATVLPSQRLTTQLSDLLLSAVVPGIPPASSSAAAADAGPRKLSSRKEELNLTSTTGNFRKFVLKVGVVFWLQDRIEEVFTWRKPAWSVCFALAWALIAFYPHLLLMVPSVIALAVLLNPTETQDKVGIARPSAVPSAAAAAAASGRASTSPTRRLSTASGMTPSSDWESRIGGSHGRSASIASLNSGQERDARASRRDSSYSESPSEKKTGSNLPPPTQGGTPESLSTTYYSNIQGIQNLMGLFSDMHDLVTPPLAAVISPTFPLHNTLIAANVLALVGVALGGGWVPTWAVLLPLGWGPLLVGAIPLSLWSSGSALAPSPALLAPLDKTYRLLLDDQVPAEIFDQPRVEVSVWETQRWGLLEAGGEGWGRSRWEGREVGSSVTGTQGAEVGSLEGIQPTGGWDWLPHEAWSIDHLGTTWTPSFARLTLNGWIHLDESHRVSPRGQDGGTEGSLRRRRWWRRAVQTDV